MYRIPFIWNETTYPSLPTTFSDSLSYYEELARLVQKMNEIIQAINEDFETLVQEGVDIYFNEIMIKSTYDEKTETLYLTKDKKGD